LTKIAVAAAACLAAAPAVASAAPDPDHVQFGLYGCRLVAGETLPNASGDFICPDSDYTHGNLGKNWNELDLVPHRLTTSTNQAQTYTIAIAADNENVGRPGYDIISAPTVNTTLSSGDCSITAAPQAIESPGQGGVDKTIYRLVTITQGAHSDCVFDYWERLALGSHLWPGSSLHSNLLNQDLTTSNIGSKEVPLPVNQISAQGFSKTMAATTGSSSVWNVTKNATPLHLDYDTCAGLASSAAQGVTVTVSWTKTQLTAGSVLLVANLKLDNPASRPVTVDVSDKLYSGTDQTTQVGSTYASGATVVPANSSVTLTDSQTVPATGATHYNDVAVATYSDPVVDPQNQHPIGTLTATADADLVTINTPNDTATITDTEQITGNGLSFSTDAVSLAGGTFTPAYTLGAHTTGPLTWTKDVTGSGSAVFTKTVYVAGPLNTTGTLSDVATLADAVGTTPAPTASASTSITARACIQGQKFNDVNGNGVHDAGEPGLAGITIYVDLNGNSAFDTGEPSAVTDASGNYSISTATIPDGTYPLLEVLPAGQVCTFPAGSCSHTTTVGPGGPVVGQDFGNYTPPPPPVVPPVVSPVTGTSTPPATPPVVVVKDTKAAKVLSGKAALYGPKRCVTNNFVAAVTGRQIAKVQFYVNNRLVATRTKRVGGRYTYTIKASSLSFAVHKLTAKVTYVAAAKTKAKTMSFTFSRCAKAAVSKVTG
jgi:hypothetical protein